MSVHFCRRSSRVFLSLLMAGIFLLCEGCSHDHHGTCNIPVQLKDYSIFQPGSYWVYRNDITGNSDSVTVSSVKQYVQPGYASYDPNIERCFMYFGGSLLSSSYIDPLEEDLKLGSGQFCLCLKSASFQPGYTSPGHFRNLDFFDSLLVNNQSYHNVMNTEFKVFTSYKDSTTYTFYIAEFIGLIKLKIDANGQDTTWSLLRYHVER